MGHKVIDISPQALPSPNNSQADGGRLDIPDSGGQQSVQVQIPNPPPEEEVQIQKGEAIALSLETIVGVNPRKRPRHRVVVCVKLESTPLAGTSFCGQGPTRHGRMWWHALLPNAMDFGTFVPYLSAFLVGSSIIYFARRTRVSWYQPIYGSILLILYTLITPLLI